MSHQRKVTRYVLGFIAPSLACTPLLADVTIGNWEDNPDGWIDWGTQSTIDTSAGSKYSYTTGGATLGNKALQIAQNGWGQNLALKLENVGLKDAFFANTQFSIDFSVPAQATAGWTEVYQLWINAANYGFVGQSPTAPVKQFGWSASGGGAQHTTLTFDYSALVDGNTANGEIAPSAGWVEFIFATNGSDAEHGVVQFDNARLTSPFVRVDLNGGGTGTLHPNQAGFTSWDTLPTAGQNGNGPQNGYPTASASNAVSTGTVASGAIKTTLTSVDVGGTPGTPSYITGATAQDGPKVNAYDMSVTGRELDGSGNFTPHKDNLYRDFAVAEAGTGTSSNGTNHRMEVKFEGLDPNTPYKVKLYAYDNSNTRNVAVFTDVTAQPLIVMPSGQSADGNFTPGDGNGGTQYAPAGQFIDGSVAPTFPATDDFRAIELYATSDGAGNLVFAETTIAGLAGQSQVLPVLNGYEIQKDQRSWQAGTGSINWNDASNWSGGMPNAKGQVANFGNTPATAITVDAPTTVARLNFSGSGLNIGGSATLTLDDTSINSTLSGAVTGRTEINLTSTSAQQTISAPLVLKKDTQVWTATPAQTLTLTNLQPAAVTLTKAGAGVLEVNNVRTNWLQVNGGTVVVLPNGGAAGASKVGSIGVATGAKVDLKDNKLVVGGNNTGSWTGTAYTGVTGLVVSGRGDGTWNGPSGITTSSASGKLTTLAVASAGDIKGPSGGTWAGQSVSATDTLVMFTYGGDANMDGKINIDDYGRIDGHVSVAGASGWFNGDFNYDGHINIDDYGIIDGNIAAQGAPFSTAGGMQSPAGLTAVPEPASAAALLALGGLPLLRRHRRGRQT